MLVDVVYRYRRCLLLAGCAPYHDELRYYYVCFYEFRYYV